MNRCRMDYSQKMEWSSTFPGVINGQGPTPMLTVGMFKFDYKNHTMDKPVGYARHKDVEKCAVGGMAFLLCEERL